MAQQNLKNGFTFWDREKYFWRYSLKIWNESKKPSNNKKKGINYFFLRYKIVVSKFSNVRHIIKYRIVPNFPFVILATIKNGLF